MISNNAIEKAGASPGWLWSDVGGCYYLVLGSTRDALEAAVHAYQGDIPSLDEAEVYRELLSLIPGDGMLLSYTNIAGMLNGFSQIPGADILGQEPFSLLSNLIPMRMALGFSSTLTNDAVTIRGALRLLPPPLPTYPIAAGYTGTVSIPELTIDFSSVGPEVGEVTVSIDVDISNAPANASIEMTAMKELTEYIRSEFELAATPSYLSIPVEDIAYVIGVDTTSLGAGNIGAATITMKVGRAWADRWGTDNIKIFRIGGEGKKEALPTEFAGYEGDYAVFVGTSEKGLSYFGLVATSKAPANWLAIGLSIGFFAVFLTIILVGPRLRTRNQK